MTNTIKKYVRHFFCKYVTHFFLKILLIGSAKTEREAADELLTATISERYLQVVTDSYKTATDSYTDIAWHLEQET